MRYVVNHMDLDQEQRARIEIAMYEAGHMMYVHPPSLAKYKADLAKFVLENDGQK
jgi:carboxypeptidase C (cathepsin A)